MVPTHAYIIKTKAPSRIYLTNASLFLKKINNRQIAAFRKQNTAYDLNTGLNIYKQSIFFSPTYYQDHINIGIKSITTLKKNLNSIWIATPISVIQIYLRLQYLIFNTTAKTATNAQKYLWFFPQINMQPGFISNSITSKSLFAAAFMSGLFSKKKTFSLVGYNYTATYEDGQIFLAIGFSHLCAFSVPYGVFVKIQNKRNIQLYSMNHLILTQTAALLKKIKKISAFTGKGIIDDTETFSLKKRSGQ